LKELGKRKNYEIYEKHTHDYLEKQKMIFDMENDYLFLI